MNNEFINQRSSFSTSGTIVPLYAYQRAHVESAARFCWLNWSRQTGKSFGTSLRRILRGMARNKNQLFLSASERQSRELMAKAATHIRAIRAKIDESYVEQTEGTETLFDGTEIKRLEIRFACEKLGFDFRIIGLPANPDTARGYTADVLLDEFAMHQDSDAIWGAVFASCMRGGGEIDVCSTPKGKQNRFYLLSQNPRFSKATVNIHDAVAQGLEVDPEEMREALGDDDLWQQEFLCKFVDEATAFLTYEMIAACEEATCPREPSDGGEIYMGVDVGRKRDLTVCWGLERVGDVDWTCFVDELSKTPFRAQFEHIAERIVKHKIRRVCVDATGLGMQLAEQLGEQFGTYRAEAVTFTAASKSEMAGPVRAAFEDRTVRIPAEVKIRNDLHSVQKIVTAAGNVRYAAERTPDGHADRFWGLALAKHAGAHAAEPVVVVSGVNDGGGGSEDDVDAKTRELLDDVMAGGLR